MSVCEMCHSSENLIKDVVYDDWSCARYERKVRCIDCYVCPFCKNKVTSMDTLGRAYINEVICAVHSRCKESGKSH